MSKVLQDVYNGMTETLGGCGELFGRFLGGMLFGGAVISVLYAFFTLVSFISRGLSA